MSTKLCSKEELCMFLRGLEEFTALLIDEGHLVLLGVVTNQLATVLFHYETKSPDSRFKNNIIETLSTIDLSRNLDLNVRLRELHATNRKLEVRIDAILSKDGFHFGTESVEVLAIENGKLGH